MRNGWAILNTRTAKFEAFFEYPIQAQKIIDKRYSGSKAFKIVDMRGRR